MNIDRSQTTFDLSQFAQDCGKPNALYGLPNEVKFCRSCVISNQRPSSAVEYKKTKEAKQDTIGFGDDGICDACRYHEEKEKQIDWNKREKGLMDLLDQHRRNDGGYDVIIPSSGGKDSAFTSHSS